MNKIKALSSLIYSDDTGNNDIDNIKNASFHREFGENDRGRKEVETVFEIDLLMKDEHADQKKCFTNHTEEEIRGLFSESERLMPNIPIRFLEQKRDQDW